MKKFLSMFLALFFIFTLSGCRNNTTNENTSSTSSIDTSSTIPNNIKNEDFDDTSSTSSLIDTPNNTQLSICPHNDTTVINRLDATHTANGYTGDTFCNTCGIVIAKGTSTPQLQEIPPTNKVTYTSDNGYVYTVDEDVNITEYSMKQQTKQIDSQHRNLEFEILKLCNNERINAGLSPLSWYEDAYYFAQIRSKEIYFNWEHKRPNGTQWHTVYTDADVILDACAENLAQQQGGENIAAGIVEAWMNSDNGHRESVLNPKFTKMAVAVTYGEDNLTICVAQHFFN